MSKKPTERRGSAMEFGQMIQAVEQLTEESRLIRTKTDELVTTVGIIKSKIDLFSASETSTHSRIGKIEEQLNRGKGALSAITAIAAGIGGGVALITEGVWHKIFH